MRGWLIISLLACSLCNAQGPLTGELLPPGGGNAIRVFPDGAYVPDWWIEKAVDSTQVWRKADAQFRVMLQTVVGTSRRLEACEGQVTKLLEIHDRDSTTAVDLHDRCLTTTDQLTTDLNLCGDKMARLKPWATLGKITVGIAAVGIVLVAIGAAKDELQP